MVAASQPIAVQAGLAILSKGGNCADAAVCIAACLNALEPASTGIGGDAFCLFFDSKTKEIKGINGSGRAPGLLSLDHALKKGFTTNIPDDDADSVTVPGAAACWVDTVEKFGSGKLTLMEILQPAIDLCQNGFVKTNIEWTKL